MAVNVTQASLAEKVGQQPSVVSHWETGERAPESYNLAALCKALGASADRILGIRTPKGPVSSGFAASCPVYAVRLVRVCRRVRF